MANDPPSSDAPTVRANAPEASADTIVAGDGPQRADESWPEQRYEQHEVIASGGMGVVRRCADRLLGRHVARKTMLEGARDGARTRFVREVRLQAVLEHPSIVPVYDLGRGPDGTPWFTMRQIAGDTLERVIAGLADGDPAIAARYGQRRLLGEFVRICQAVAYAHSRGVVHRDLKPSNVILSDYGEVYVLDWGIAKVRGEHEDPIQATGSPTTAATADGAVLGTLGYMPPEQLDGGGAHVDGRADVYALGTILFELLTLEPLHPRGDPSATIRSTMAGADARPSARAPDRGVPPELEAVCVRATARRIEERFTDVAEMIAAIERYLDGDRDLRRRRELADEHARLAEVAMTAARSDLAARERAANEAGRALALDPTHSDALRVITRLFVDPPEILPPEVEAKLRSGDAESSRAMARFGAAVRLVWLAVFVGIAAMGVRMWPLYLAIVALLVLAAFGAARFGTAGGTDRVPMLVMVMNAAMIAAMGTLFGPFVLVPALAVVTTVAFLLGGARDARVAVAFGIAAVMIPYALELAGVVPVTTTVAPDVITIMPVLASFAPLPTHLVLVVAHVAVLVMAGVAVSGARSRLRAARSRELLQAWHFEKVLPASART
jgi:serine/threonine-protein kinase